MYRHSGAMLDYLMSTYFQPSIELLSCSCFLKERTFQPRRHNGKGYAVIMLLTKTEKLHRNRTQYLSKPTWVSKRTLHRNGLQNFNGWRQESFGYACIIRYRRCLSISNRPSICCLVTSVMFTVAKVYVLMNVCSPLASILQENIIIIDNRETELLSFPEKIDLT